MTTLPSYQAVANIQRVVAKAYGISAKEMRLPNRRRYAAWPRQVAMYLARERTDKSFTVLANLFGGLDHTTVIHGVRAVKDRMETVRGYRDDVEAIRERLG